MPLPWGIRGHALWRRLDDPALDGWAGFANFSVQFREVDPTAYEELGEAIRRLLPDPERN